MLLGEPIHGELHSSDASAGVAITIYNQGSKTARTLASNEYIEIESLEVVSVAGGDVTVFGSTDGTIDAGETIVRGTVAANSGIAMSKMRYTAKNGDSIFVKAPAGVVDAVFSGSIRQETDKARPAWRESLVPGQ